MQKREFGIWDHKYLRLAMGVLHESYKPAEKADMIKLACVAAQIARLVVSAKSH